jgi:hypothetical protein
MRFWFREARFPSFLRKFFRLLGNKMEKRINQNSIIIVNRVDQPMRRRRSLRRKETLKESNASAQWKKSSNEPKDNEDDHV